MKSKKKNVSLSLLSAVLLTVVAVCIALALVMIGKKPPSNNVSGEYTSQHITQEESTTKKSKSKKSKNPSNTVSETSSEAAAENTDVEPSASESTESKKKEVFYTTADLNVRTGPGTEYEKTGIIPKGSKVTRLDEKNGWSKIKFDGGEKYVSSQYLTEEKPSESTTQGEIDISQVKRKVVDPRSGNWELTVVNAYIEYDRSYTPELKEVCPGMGYDRYMDVRAADHFTEMYNAAKKDGITLVPISGYRSYELQEKNWKARIANEQAKGYSRKEAVARASEVILPPGTSEHNLGIAMDICSLYESFANTEEYAWLCEHAEDYGFILRYKAEWKSKTGIVPEPWHWRYVGVENARKINASGLCLEDYVARLG